MLIFRRLVFSGLGLVFLVGCWGAETAESRIKAMTKGELKSLVAVNGTVRVDGEPASNVILTLHTKDGNGSLNTTITDEEGGYCWTTYIGCDGIEAGEYLVTFKRFRNAQKEKGDELLLGRYSNPLVNKHELKVGADEGELNVDFDLKMK